MRRTWLIIGLIVLLPLAVFWQTRNFDFVWDDEVNVAKNPYLNALTLSNVKQFWQKPYESLYIPMTYTVWAGIASFARLSTGAYYADQLYPKPFHLANLVLHILNAIVVFTILTTLVRQEWAACAGALLFALHPVQVEPVAWVTGMKDLLSGFLSLVALWQYLSYSMVKISLVAPASSERNTSNSAGKTAAILERKARFHYLAATMAFIAATLAKPTAVVTPAIALLLDNWALKRPLRDSALALTGWLVLAIPFVLGTKLAQPESELEFVTPLWARPLIAADALAFYLYKLFLPLWLAPDYGRVPELVIEKKWLYLTWAVPCAVAVLIWLGRRRRPWLIAAGGIFIAGFLPVSGLVPFRFQNSSTVADRYLYLSMMGPAVAVAWLISERRKRVMAVVCGVVFLVLGVISWWQARYWQNEVTLFSHVVELNPRSWAAHYGLGRALVKQGNKSAAIGHFREAARLQPQFTKAHFSLAGLLTARGDLDQAITEYRQALRIAPRFIDAHLGLGNALALQGDFEGAINEYRGALELDPKRSDICFGLGNLLVRKGSLAEAVASFNRAIQIRPDFVAAHNSLGRVLAAQGDLNRAIDHFREALRIDPTLDEAHESLALALAQQGKTEEAERHTIEAQRLKTSRSR